MSFFSGLFRSRDKPQNRTAGSSYSFFFGNTTSGKPVTERTAMQMTAVYSCVRILSEAVAGLPIHVYRYTDNGGKERALEHPLYRLLHDEPNPEMTSFNFRETLMSHLLLYGNAYAQIIRNARGEVMGLYPLMPNKMSVDRDRAGNLYYLYSCGSDDAPVGKENGQVYLLPSDVLHIPGLGYDGIVGYSPLAMAKNAVGMAIACEEYGAKFFANGAAPGGVLEHPGIIKDPQKVKESWNAVYQGSGNSHKIAVLEEGMKYQAIGISPEQAQFLETRKFQINEIARIYRVPPHMVGDLEKSSFSNIEQQSLEFVKYTLDPWICRWEQSLSRRLFTENEKRTYFIRFNVEGLLRGDYQSRMNGYAVARQNGWMTISNANIKMDGSSITFLNANGAIKRGTSGSLQNILSFTSQAMVIGAYSGNAVNTLSIPMQTITLGYSASYTTLTLSANTTNSGTFKCTGAATFSGSASHASTSSFTGAATFNGTATFASTCTHNGTTNLKATSVSGALSCSSTATFSGATRFTGSIGFYGASAVSKVSVATCSAANISTVYSKLNELINRLKTMGLV